MVPFQFLETVVCELPGNREAQTLPTSYQQRRIGSCEILARRAFAVVQDKRQGSSHFRALNPPAMNLVGRQYEELSGPEPVRCSLSLQALLTHHDVPNFRARMNMHRRGSLFKQG